MDRAINIDARDLREGFEARIALPLLLVTLLSFGWMAYHIKTINLNANQAKLTPPVKVAPMPVNQSKSIPKLNIISVPNSNSNLNGATSTASPQLAPASNLQGGKPKPGPVKDSAPTSSVQAAPKLLPAVQAPVNKLL